MAKRYTRINWQNKPNTATPISAENLNKMDKGIKDCDDAIGDLALLTTNNKTDLVSAINEQNNNLAVKDISSSVTTTGLTNPTVFARKMGNILFLTITGTVTSGLAAYTPFAVLNGYTANGNQHFKSVTGKDLIIYNNGANIMARVALASGDDITFTTVLLIK